MDDGEGGVNPDQVKTKNEIADVQVVIPEVEKLEEHEIEMLQKVGDVLNIIDKVVIVKGIPQHLRGRESDRALDSDTLLVFDDGRVLGYVSHELASCSKSLLMDPWLDLGDIWSHYAAFLPSAIQRSISS